MAVSESFRTFVVDQLSRVAPGVRSRRMFGGLGIYSNDVFFAVADDDVLYFKVDDSNRGDFEARGLGPFRPYGPDGEAMQYYEIPADLLEDTDALAPWVDKAIAVAVAKKAKAKGSKRARPRRKGSR